jgi:hypothetical protein
MADMKKLLELLVCFLHPVAVILLWINLAGRSDLSGGVKLAWGLVGLIPLVPFVYVLTGGDLWLARFSARPARGPAGRRGPARRSGWRRAR